MVRIRYEQGPHPQPHSASQQKRPLAGPVFVRLAERVGFEPTKGYKPLLVFKTSAFNRSATSPVIAQESCERELCAQPGGDSTAGKPAAIRAIQRARRDCRLAPNDETHIRSEIVS